MPQSTDRNAFKAGLFILISIALTVAVIVGIKGIGHFTQKSTTHVVHFKLGDDVGGLGPGDEVRVGGARVGDIQSINVEIPRENAAPGIDITFNMPQRFVLRRGAEVSVQSTVTGVSVLNFTNLGTGEPIGPDETLAGSPGALTSFLASAGKLGPELVSTVQDIHRVTLPKANEGIDSANALLKHVDTQVPPIVQRYNTIADKGATAMDAVSGYLNDTKGDFRGTMRNLNASTDTIRQKLPDILEQAHGALDKVNEAVGRANDALLDVKQVAANARDITGAGREIIVGNHWKIDAMIADLKTTGDNLKNATAEIRRSPWRLLYKPGPGEMANLNLFDSARQFADGANSLSDAAGALRDALKANPNDAKKLDALMLQLDKSFTHFNAVEQDLWSQVKQ